MEGRKLVKARGKEVKRERRNEDGPSKAQINKIYIKSVGKVSLIIALKSL